MLLFSGIYEDASTLSETAYSGLYSTTFALWREKAAAYDKEYRSLLERIHDKAIVAHRQLSDTVYKTTWEDGTVVLCNYGDSPLRQEGVTIGGGF